MIELDFQNFIINEVAFAQSYGYKNGGFNSSASYGNRVMKGQGIEYEIRQAMKEDMGWITKDASSRDDMNNGIDCWIVSQDGGKTKISQIPLQIKARKNASGNDILWETIKPWTEDIPTRYHNLGDAVFNGKDMKCRASLMVSVSNDGNYLRFRKVDEIINIAKSLGKGLIETYMANGRKMFSDSQGQARVLKDPSQQANYSMRGDVFKVNSFISPFSFEWKKDVKLDAPINAV